MIDNKIWIRFKFRVTIKTFIKSEPRKILTEQDRPRKKKQNISTTYVMYPIQKTSINKNMNWLYFFDRKINMYWLYFFDRQINIYWLYYTMPLSQMKVISKMIKP